MRQFQKHAIKIFSTENNKIIPSYDSSDFLVWKYEHDIGRKLIYKKLIMCFHVRPKTICEDLASVEGF